MSEHEWSPSADHIGALSVWNIGEHQAGINRTLRSGDLEKYSGMIAGLDSAVSAGIFHEPIIAYRGVAISRECHRALRVGHAHVELGYTSLTLNRETAKRFADGRAGIEGESVWLAAVRIVKTGDVPVVLEIEVPAGTHAAALCGNGLDEFLLGRESVLTISSISDGVIQARLSN